MNTSISEIRREECGYTDQIEMLSFVVDNGVCREQLTEIPFPKGTTDADLLRWVNFDEPARTP